LPPAKKKLAELKAEVKADVKRQFTPKRPPPSEEPVDPIAKAWAKGYLQQPLQYDLNKPDDYTHCLSKQVSSIKAISSSASGKRDVAELK
jgi:hypothetical protein